MANQKHLEILKQGVEIWNEWRKEYPQERPDLSEANLDNMNLSKINLANVNLDKATLRDAHLIEADISLSQVNQADLTKADLRRANLTATHFNRTIMIEAIFRKTNCTLTIFCTTNLFKADFSEASLNWAILIDANLNKANLFRADLHYANLQGANLTNANFYRANLNNTNFLNAVLTGVNLYSTYRNGWIIKGVKCEYVYNDEFGKERFPENRDFQPNEFAEKENRSQYQRDLTTLWSDRPTLYVEGLTDVAILQAAIDLFQPELNKIIVIRSDHSAGYPWVKEQVIAWVCSRKKSYVAGLFDDDSDAKEAKMSLVNFLKRKPNAKTFNLGKFKPIHLQRIFQVFQKDMPIPITLEEIYPPSIWEYADQQGWLEDRVEIIRSNKFEALNKSFEEYCNDNGLTQQEQRYVLKKVKKYKKEKLVDYILKLEPNDQMQALHGFESFIKALSEFFKRNL